LREASASLDADVVDLGAPERAPSDVDAAVLRRRAGARPLTSFGTPLHASFVRMPTRREFCEGAVFGLGACALSAAGCRRRSSTGPSTPDGSAPTTSTAPPRQRNLSPEAFATLAAVCDRILPRDEDPGALDLGVPDYIDAMLGTEDLAPVQQTLGKVFPVLDKEAAKKFGGKRFAEIQPAEQDAILETWQKGTESRQKFFDVAISLTMEGAFSDPKYGGNIGGAGLR
jgi:gluconate 2-dehydrogenase gamma chain